VIATGVTGPPDQLLWAQNLGGGVFGPPRLIYRQTGGTTFVAAGDLDGLADLVIGDQSGRFAYFENRLGRGAEGRDVYRRHRTDVHLPRRGASDASIKV
jgi:hypothetical protein